MFKIVEVIQAVVDEVQAARLERLPVGLPDVVRFEIVTEDDDLMVTFEIPLLGDRKPLNEMMFLEKDVVVTHSYGGAKEN